MVRFYAPENLVELAKSLSENHGDFSELGRRGLKMAVAARQKEIILEKRRQKEISNQTS